MRRVVTALVLAGLAVPAILLLPSVGVLVLVVLIVEAAAFELEALWRHYLESGPFRALAVLLPAFCLALAIWPPTFTHGGVALGAMLLTVALLLPLVLRTPLPQAAPSGALLSLSLLYLGVPAVSLYRLHRLDPWLVFLLLAIVALQDSAAFYVGRSIGKRRLAVHVSPNKTWEGAVAGFVVGVGAAVLWPLLGPHASPQYGAWALLGCIVAVAAQVGDLCESMIKRGAGVKDSGNLLPGHGGVLDRIDALLFAAPVFLLALRALGLDGRP